MESQPQNPEFRNNPENFHPCHSQCQLSISGPFGSVFYIYFVYIKFITDYNIYKHYIKICQKVSNECHSKFI